MQITTSSIATGQGPAEWFTGAVYVDTVTNSTPPSRLQAASVHFTPGARTAWHTHPVGQTIYVIEGVGRCQRRGGPIEVIRPGDRVFFETKLSSSLEPARSGRPSPGGSAPVNTSCWLTYARATPTPPPRY